MKKEKRITRTHVVSFLIDFWVKKIITGIPYTVYFFAGVSTVRAEIHLRAARSVFYASLINGSLCTRVFDNNVFLSSYAFSRVRV